MKGKRSKAKKGTVRSKAPRRAAPSCSAARNPMFGDFVPLWSIASDENYLLQASDRARCGTPAAQPPDKDFVPPPQPQKQRTSPFDFDERPLVAIWETTQAC